MKYLTYNEQTGEVKDANGNFVTTMLGFVGIDIKESVEVDDLIKLKNAGFTADEIISIKKAGLA